MIKIFLDGKESLDKVFLRSQLNKEEINKSVAEIVNDVKINKDKALFKYTMQFDKLDLEKEGIVVTEEEISAAFSQVSDKLLASIRKAKANITSYHMAHLTKDKVTEANGVKVGMLIRPLERAGVYVPGGTASYPSSVMMTVLLAKVAGVKEVFMCSPNPKNALTLVAAKECGVDKIYKIGGAQAIAAMAYGTECVPKVDIIVGPGNIYVTLAKKLVFGEVKIDMIAGPSEIMIIADAKANPKYVAADLLSQAEHDRLSASILVTDSLELATAVKEEVSKQAQLLSRKDIIIDSLRDNGAIIVVKDIQRAIDIANQVAPEHLEVCVENSSYIVDRINNAGAVFVGNYSPEPLGDYFAGPSHVLPTSGTARHFEVLNSDTFVRKMSYIEYTKEALSQAKEDIFAIATEEGFDAHANTVNIREY